VFRREFDHLGRSSCRHCQGSRRGGTVAGQRRGGRGVAAVAGGGGYRHVVRPTVATTRGVRLHQAVAHGLLLASLVALEYLDDGHHGGGQDDARLAELLEGIVVGGQSGDNRVGGQRLRLVVRRAATTDLNRRIAVIGTVCKGK